MAESSPGPRQLILLRHGTPLPEEEDSARPLAEKGREEAEFTARGVTEYLKAVPAGGPQAERRALVLHSGKTRAQQTAECVANALRNGGWEALCEPRDGLSPNDTPAAGLELARAVDAPPVMVLVGHLPHIGQLAAALVGRPAAAGRLGGLFHPAGGIVLEREDVVGEGSAAWREATEVAVGVSWWMEAPPPPQ
mmetsp:Transcript_11937/g.32269  ORF Transcript_11937/g.32269 Transcript_11937/m.32269 type:complete len:194 (-) Transcript_11937:83-664(-)